MRILLYFCIIIYAQFASATIGLSYDESDEIGSSRLSIVVPSSSSHKKDQANHTVYKSDPTEEFIIEPDFKIASRRLLSTSVCFPEPPGLTYPTTPKVCAAFDANAVSITSAYSYTCDGGYARENGNPAECSFVRTCSTTPQAGYEPTKCFPADHPPMGSGDFSACTVDCYCKDENLAVLNEPQCHRCNVLAPGFTVNESPPGTFDVICQQDYYGPKLTWTCSDGDFHREDLSPTCAICDDGAPSPPTGITRQKRAPNHYDYRCSAGYYSTSTAVHTQTCHHHLANPFTSVGITCKPCSNPSGGHYCPGGTDSLVRNKCPAGRFGSPAHNNDNPNCSGPCQAGYYCPEGSSSENQTPCGGADKYCPTGAATPSTVSPGHYTCNQMSGSDCIVDPDPNTRSMQAPCPPHRRCSNGVIEPAFSGIDECPGGEITLDYTEDTDTTFSNVFVPIFNSDIAPTFVHSASVAQIEGATACAVAPSDVTTSISGSGVKLSVKNVIYPNCTSGFYANVIFAYAGTHPYPNDDLTTTCRVRVNVRQTLKAPILTNCANQNIKEGVYGGAKLSVQPKAENLNVGTVLRWELIDLDDVTPFRFQISSCSGEITVTPGRLRYVPRHIFNMKVIVTNNGTAIDIPDAKTAECTFTVTMIRQPRAPLLRSASHDIDDLQEPDTFVGEVDPWDEDGYPITPITGWAATIPNPDHFYIENNKIYVKNYFDAKELDQYLWNYKVNVASPYRSEVRNVHINVKLAPRAPVFTDQARNVNELTPGGTNFGGRLSHTQASNLPVVYDDDVFDGGVPSPVFGVRPDGTLYVRASGLIDFRVREVYNVQVLLRLRDYEELFTYGNVKITVIEENKPPRWEHAFVPGPYLLDVPEGTAAGYTVLRSPDIRAVDDNIRDKLTYSRSSCTPSGYLSFHSTNAHLYVAHQMDASPTKTFYYYEERHNSGNEFTVTCTLLATDSYSPPLQGTTTVIVTITKVAPRIYYPDYSISGTIGMNENIVDMNDFMKNFYPSHTLNFEIIWQEPTPEGVVSPFVVHDNVHLCTASGPAIPRSPGTYFNYNTKKNYIVTIKATDIVHNTNVVGNITLSLEHKNRQPWWNALPQTHFTITSRTKTDIGNPFQFYADDLDLLADVGEKLSYYLDDTLEGAFKIHATTGQLSVDNEEAPAMVYPPGGPAPVNDVSVCVKDKGVNGPVLHACTVVQIELIEDEYPPTFPEFDPIYIDEFAPVDTWVAELCSDDPVSLDLEFQLVAAGGSINRPFPFREEKIVEKPWCVNVYVRNDNAYPTPCDHSPVLASMNPPCHESSQYDATLSGTDLMRVPGVDLTGYAPLQFIVNKVPMAPYFHPDASPFTVPPTMIYNSHTFYFTVPEKSVAGFVVETEGLKAKSKDYGKSDTLGDLKYSWKAGTSPDPSFSIHPNTAAVTVTSHASLSHTFQSTYTYTVEVKDPEYDLTDTATVVIEVIDKNDPSTFVHPDAGLFDRQDNTIKLSGTEFKLIESATVGYLVGYLRAYDEDTHPLWGAKIYNLADTPDAEFFEIDQDTGALSVAFGATFDWNDQDLYSLKVICTDADPTAPLTSSLDFTVRLQQINRVTITALADPGDVPDNGIIVPGTEPGFPASEYPDISILTNTEGGNVVEIVGTAFGKTAARLAREGLTAASTIVKATYGPTGTEQTAENCHVVVPNTVIRCTTVPGVGERNTWIVHINNQWESPPSDDKSGYLPPVILQMYLLGSNPANNAEQVMPTDGQDALIVVKGSNFGPRLISGSPVSVRLRYGPTGIEYVVPACVWIEDHVEVHCPVQQGVGFDFQWRVVVGGQESVFFVDTTLRYAPPTVTAVEAPVLSTRGEDTFHIHGYNFGPSSNPNIIVRYSRDPTFTVDGDEPIFYATNCRIPANKNHVQITCTAAEGMGVELYAQVEVAEQLSNSSPDTMSYVAPVIQDLLGAGVTMGSTEGGGLVMIAGENFGPASVIVEGPQPYSHFIPVVHYGAYDFENDVWERLYVADECKVVTDSQIQCLTVEGYGTGLYWKIIDLGGQGSPLFTGKTSDYHPPIVAFYSGEGSADAFTQGGQEVHIEGKNFGPIGTPIDSVVYKHEEGDEFVADDCAVTTAHLVVTCLTAVGAGKDLAWFVRIGGQDSVSPSTGYGAPIITGFDGPGAVDANTDGGQIVEILGEYFSITKYLDYVTYGPSGTEFVATDCVVAVDHVKITCKTVPGVGRVLRWIVSVGGQTSSPSEDTTSYAAPEILEIRPIERMSPTVGGDMFTIVAKNAGVNYPLSSIRIYVNARGRLAPGAIARDPLAFIHDPNSIPTLRSTYTPSVNLLEYWDAVVNAEPVPSHLVPVRTWIQSLESPRAINPHIVDDHHEIQFEMPAGFGLNREVFITVNGIPSNIKLVGFDPPFIKNVAPDRHNVSIGQLRVFVEGSNFCDGRDNCGQVLLNNATVVPESYAYRDHQLLFVIEDLPANAPLQEVRVAVGGVPSNTLYFRKPAPNFDEQVEQDVWEDMATAGGELFQIYGVLEIGQEDVTVHIGPYQCVNVTRAVDNGKDPLDSEASFTLTCYTPPGVGKNHHIIVETLGGTSRANDDFVFHYADPTIDNIYLWNVSPTPSRRLTPGVPDFENLPVFSFEDSLSHGTAALGTLGGYIVLTGMNFGAGDLLNETMGIGASAYMDHVYELPIVYHTHHYVVIEVPPFEGGKDRVITFNIAGAPSNMLEISAALPEVHGISPDHGPTRGGTLVTISGENFGTLPPTVMFVDADNEERECTLATDPFVPSPGHDTITCHTPHFQGLNIEVRITVSDQDSVVLTGTPLFNYDPPTIMDITPRNTTTSGRHIVNIPEDNSSLHIEFGNRTLITVTGENFGTEGTIMFVEKPYLLGNHIDPWTNMPYESIAVPDDDIVSWTDEEIKFYAQPGIGVNLQLLVHAGDQPSVPDLLGSTTSFSYEPPVLYSWYRVDRSPDQCQPLLVDYTYDNVTYTKEEPAQCYDTRGDYSIYITGASFYNNLQFVSVLIGNTTAVPEAVNHDVLTVRVPRGLGDFKLIEVNVKGYDSIHSNNSYFHYDKPILDFAIPNTPDAMGELIILRGKNFGFVETPSKLVVSSPNHNYTIEPLDYLGDTVLQFVSEEDVVGSKQLELYVANRSAPTIFYHFEERFIAECKRGFMGLEGEYCLPCPAGAECPGSERTEDLTYSLPGFWRTLVPNPSEFCPEKHRDPDLRPYCPLFLACSPPESCVGNNECAEGYEGERCAFCLKGTYYRVNGDCIKCPDSPVAVLIGFVALALFGIFASWFLTKYNVTITLLTVGLDYAQVISIFARTKINWPPEILYIFKFLSAFNFNIEIAAPECLLENVTFLNKWLAIELLPLIALCLLFLMFSTKFLYKFFCLKRKRNSLFSHLPQMLSVFIVIFRVLYLFITRSALDVFSCSPTQPPDGKEYMAGMLDIVCGEPGSIQTRLVPYAALAVVFYVVGFPLSAFIFMSRNKYKIKHDQILRAKDWGNDRITNPKYYTFRKTWHKLYYHFKPGKWYWEVIIIGRKFFIAFTSLMFRQTPDYQLAMALLVLFVAYLLHVKSHPYLTHRDKPTVIAEHLKKAKAGHPLHREIEESMRTTEKANRLNRNASQLRQLDDVHMFDPNKMSGADIVLHNIFNHNTVEAVLLACAVLVNLAGIMFNSARFVGDLQHYYRDEYKSLAYATIVLISGSLIYYVFVLFADILISVAPSVAMRVLTCGKIENVINRAKARSRGKILVGKNNMISKTTNHDAGDVDLQVSQLFQQTRLGGVNAGGITVSDLQTIQKPPGPVEWTAIKSAFIANIRAVSDLQSEVQKHKRELEELFNKKEIESSTEQMTQNLPHLLAKKSFQSASLYSTNGNDATSSATGGAKYDGHSTPDTDDNFTIRNPLATATNTALYKEEEENVIPPHAVDPVAHDAVDVDAIDFLTPDTNNVPDNSTSFNNPFFANRNPMAAEVSSKDKDSGFASLHTDSETVSDSLDSPVDSEVIDMTGSEGEPGSPGSAEEDLPAGWYSAVDEEGDTYYYTEDGRSQWDVPTEAA